ncbi:MAG: hypothetical protein RL417_12 [Pseudomonadota bacterium]|jgi:hypothetical protein
MKRFIVGALVLLGCLVSSQVFAEERYSVRGQIKTEMMACPAAFGVPCEAKEPEAVKGARVVITNSRRAFVTATRSRDDGGFKVRLRRGTYTASLPGFDVKKRFRVLKEAADLGIISVIPR